jgi:hypothetical protein
MKKHTINQFALLLMTIFVFSSCASTRIARDPNAQYLGEWEYVVEDLPVDIDGTFVITDVEGILNGALLTPMGDLDIGEIKIVDGVLEASFDADGNYVDLAGTFEGENYNGTLTVQDTDFVMKMTKKEAAD